MSSSIPSNRKRARNEITDNAVEVGAASNGGLESAEENAIELLAAAPAPKKSKAGRKPIPDGPCEHGPSRKTCQKCIYRRRNERASMRFDDRGVLTKLVLMWCQNLVYFSSLASILALSEPGSKRIDEISKIIDTRMLNFKNYVQAEMSKLAQVRSQLVEEVVILVLNTMHPAFPASTETVFIAKWILERQKNWLRETTAADEEEDILASVIGKACAKFTERVAVLWEDNMLCPGILERDLVDHFKHWKGAVSKNSDGVFGVLAQGQDCIRSIHCNGFTSEGLCDRCLQVRSLLMKEKMAYKTDPPGYILLVKSLPPAFKSILDGMKVQPDGDSPLLGPAEDVEEGEMMATMETVDLVQNPLSSGQL